LAAAALAWLLDPAQAWVIGQILGVDGGLATLRPKVR
jgi:NAD(P)-dependent dehydrogenase (short-subunit alcohol dehydrogenase family)